MLKIEVPEDFDVFEGGAKLDMVEDDKAGPRKTRGPEAGNRGDDIAMAGPRIAAPDCHESHRIEAGGLATSPLERGFYGAAAGRVTGGGVTGGGVTGGGVTGGGVTGAEPSLIAPQGFSVGLAPAQRQGPAPHNPEIPFPDVVTPRYVTSGPVCPAEDVGRVALRTDLPGLCGYDGTPSAAIKTEAMRAGGMTAAAPGISLTTLKSAGIAPEFHIHDGVRHTPDAPSIPGDKDQKTQADPIYQNQFPASKPPIEAAIMSGQIDHGSSSPQLAGSPADREERSRLPQGTGHAATMTPLRAPLQVPFRGGDGPGGDGGGGWPLWGKLLVGFSAFGILCMIASAIVVFLYFEELRKDIPGTDVLLAYEPAVTTRVHASNGELVGEFARERRLFVPIETIPDHVKQSFISAEDKNFYSHGGVDLKGVVRATINNIRFKLEDSNQLHGASTITQQVAKNFLLSSERTYRRKFREWLTAWEMEKVLSKDEILELYLNEINLGNRSYGVAAAALNYFDKSLPDLTVAEAAYLAALPKAPNNYHPIRNEDRAISRRNWIIGRVLEDGFITEDIADMARKTPLGAKISPPLGARTPDTEYFVEAVRRQIVDLSGVDALYDGGLSVRTTLDPRLQSAAQRAFRKWLVVYDQRHGWRGELDSIELPDNLDDVIASDQGAHDERVFVWQHRLKSARRDLIKSRKFAPDLAPWRLAVVLETAAVQVRIGFVDGSSGHVPLDEAGWARAYIDANTVGAEVTDMRTLLDQGDVVLVEAVQAAGIDEAGVAANDGEAVTDQVAGQNADAVARDIGTDETGFYALRQVPGVNGGFIAIDPHTGQVRAMVGGFSFGLSEFNRAIQANRQPGSTFKPFVYTAALDNGYTPSSIVLDAPFVAPSLDDEWWRPGNYIAGRFYGNSTLRLGIEKSRNTMTARLAQDIGIGMIIDYAERFGVSETLPRELAISLGAGETTLTRLTSAYSIFVNGGKRIEPVFIDRIQNRYGKTVFKRDHRPCVNCLPKEWNDQREPRLSDPREQIVDPRTAYQMVSILEGAVRSGTGVRVREHITKPLAGKTGTTDDYRDAWFVGFSPDLAAGVFVGFDLPASMGQGEGGGIVAAPVFGEFMKAALAEETAIPFRAPSGIRQVRVNAKTGKPARVGESNVILEAFKAGDDLYGGSDFALRGENVEAGVTDEAVDDALGGLY